MARSTENTAFDVRIEHEPEQLEIPGSKRSERSALTNWDSERIETRSLIHEITHREKRSVETTADLGSEDILGSRAAARKIALLTTDEEYQELLGEHRRLVEKRFKDGLARSEELRLQLLRWTLDRIEDARYGHDLDLLERLTAAHEYIASNVARATDELERVAGSQGRRTKK